VEIVELYTSVLNKTFISPLTIPVIASIGWYCWSRVKREAETENDGNIDKIADGVFFTYMLLFAAHYVAVFTIMFAVMFAVERDKGALDLVPYLVAGACFKTPYSGKRERSAVESAIGVFFTFVIPILVCLSLTFQVHAIIANTDFIPKDLKTTEWLLAASYAEYLIGAMILTYLQNTMPTPSNEVRRDVLNLIFTILILGTGIGGFYIMPDNIRAGIFLFFLVWAYPLVLSFTRAGAVDKFTQGDLIALYKEGLTQIPIVGKLFSDVVGGAPSRREAEPPINADAKPEVSGKDGTKPSEGKSKQPPTPDKAETKAEVSEVNGEDKTKPNEETPKQQPPTLDKAETKAKAKSPKAKSKKRGK
jgi:hypothetical protein